jgi:trans-aconitate methyltransferase
VAAVTGPVLPSALFECIQDTLRTAARLDQEWLQKITQSDQEKQRFTPWMPYPLYEFVALLAEAVPAAPGGRFLDIGAGPGTKMLVAQELFGLDCRGVERVPEYVDAAAEMGLAVSEADALGWGGYGDFDVAWFNRVFRDPGAQAALEAQIWERAVPFAVVICANLEEPPGWWPVLDAWADTRRGIYQKPPP